MTNFAIEYDSFNLAFLFVFSSSLLFIPLSIYFSNNSTTINRGFLREELYTGVNYREYLPSRPPNLPNNGLLTNSDFVPDTEMNIRITNNYNDTFEMFNSIADLCQVLNEATTGITF